MLHLSPGTGLAESRQQTQPSPPPAPGLPAPLGGRFGESEHPGMSQKRGLT